MDRISVRCKRLGGDHRVILPQYQTPGSSGMDLHAFLREPLVLHPGEYRLIPSGIAISIPEGFEAQIRPRSGLAANHGITVLNGCGTIDSDYRGEIKVILINLGKDDFVIHSGDRIAQMVFSKVIKAELAPCEELDDTGRNCGGFGHTGK